MHFKKKKKIKHQNFDLLLNHNMVYFFYKYLKESYYI